MCNEIFLVIKAV